MTKKKTATKKGFKKVSKIPVVETAESLERKIALEEMVAAQLTDRRFSNDVSYDSLTKNVTYVTAKNGLFKVTKSPIGLFKELIQEFNSPVVGIPEMEAGVDLVIPKIPMKYMIEALSWYRDVNTKDKTEVSTLFFWNHKEIALPALPGLRRDGKLVIYCPIQENTATLSDFTMDDEVVWMRENLALLLEVHSHNSMDAFFSGTDDANENNTQFYAVWGKVASEQPAFAFRYVVGDTKMECDPSILIDWPVVDRIVSTVKTETVKFHGDASLFDLDLDQTEKTKVHDAIVTETKSELLQGPFKIIDYPADWMAQHSKPVYKAGKVKGGAWLPKTTGYPGETAFGQGGYGDYYNYGRDSYWEDTPLYEQGDLLGGYPEPDYPEPDYDEDEPFVLSPYENKEASVELEGFVRDVVKEMIASGEDFTDYKL